MKARLLASIFLIGLVAPLAAEAGEGENLLPLGKPEPGNRHAGCQVVSRQEAVAALDWSGRMGQYNFGEGDVCNIGLGPGLVMIDLFNAGTDSAVAARIDARKRRLNRFQIERRIPNSGARRGKRS